MYVDFAVGFGLARLGVVLLDVDADRGLRELGLHVGGAARLLGLDALVLRLALHLEGFYLLVRDLALGEHRDQRGRVDHVLDVDAAGFDLVFGELASGCRRRLLPARSGGSG